MPATTTRTKEIDIRVARPDDHEEVSAMLRAFRQEHGLPEPALSELPPLEGGSLRVLVAVANGEQVGFLVTQRCHNLLRGSSFLLLSDIYVPPIHRRRGVAKALMAEAKQLAAELRCQGLSLIVADFNEAALTTAARAGFTRHEELLLSFTEE